VPALHSAEQQQKRLGNEPRLDEPLSPGDWERRKYPFPQDNSAAELARWSLMEWDRLTDETAEARYRKAARPLETISLDTVVRYDQGEPVTAGDQAALEQSQREQREEEETPRIEDWREFYWWESLSDAERITIRLLAGESGESLNGPHALPSRSQADYLPRGRSGREVARMLGVSENMIRKRREAAARKLSEAGIQYRTRGARPNRGREWCARRPAPRLGCAPHALLREAVTGVQSSQGRLSPAA
jgi:hypothetical protein